MDKDRLLTVEELKAQAEHIDTSKYNLRPVHASGALAAKWLRAQDSKTSAIVQAATLRAVGEAFEARSFVVASEIPDLDGKTAVYLEQSDLTDLRNGQWPAGWEKE